MNQPTSPTGRKIRIWTRVSIALNILFICGTIILFILLAKKNYFRKFFPQAQTTVLNYADNAAYENFTTVYPLYERQKNIVMLGNSLTAYANWGELLDRTDVATRGINGDITAGFLARLPHIIRLKPRIVFIEGGINDLNQDLAPDSIIQNLTLIIDTLQMNGIKPVLSTVTLLSERYDPARLVTMNQKINELNGTIARLAQERNIHLIDLNRYVSNKNILMEKYVVKDGIHFTGKTYKIWKEEVEKILKQENI